MKSRHIVYPPVWAIIALLLTVVWLPEPFTSARPLWLLMLVCYVQVFLPEHFNVLGVVVLGLILDVLCPNVLGVHVLALILPSYCLLERARRFSFFSVAQQTIWITALSLLYQFILSAVAWSMGYNTSISAILLPVITTSLFWIWFRSKLILC